MTKVTRKVEIMLPAVKAGEHPQVVTAQVEDDGKSGIFTPNFHVSIGFKGAARFELVGHGRSEKEAVEALTSGVKAILKEVRG